MSKRTLLAATPLLATLALWSFPASANVLFATGNVQYNNVNIAADTNATVITGDIGNTGITMTFNSMVGPDGTTQNVEMHGQHGVAFVESYLDSLTNTHTGFAAITLTPQAGYGFSAGDFALDQLNTLTSPTGKVTLTGIDQYGNSTSAILAISQNGQNTYNFTTANGELVTSLVISVATSDLLVDIKAVSLDAAPVPEPLTLSLIGTGLAGLGIARWRRR